MNKISDMIKELCPNGVEYTELKNVINYQRGKGLSKKEKRTGHNPIILYGELYTTYGNYITEIVSFASNTAVKSATCVKKGSLLLPISSTTKEAQIGRAAVLKCSDAYLGGDAISLYPHNNIDSDFLMYFINSITFEKEKMKCVRGTTIQHLDPNKLLKIKVPVPPLEVQREIVHYLDQFTLLTAEFTSELEMRKKQYEHYRDSLLTFSMFSP